MTSSTPSRSTFLGTPVLAQLREWKESAPSLLQNAKAGIKMLERSPTPDGIVRRTLPSPPYKPGTLGVTYGNVFITYGLTPTELRIWAVQPSPYTDR
jgi:hypothetical protein